MSTKSESNCPLCRLVEGARSKYTLWNDDVMIIVNSSSDESIMPTAVFRFHREPSAYEAQMMMNVVHHLFKNFTISMDRGKNPFHPHFHLIGAESK